MKEEGAEDRKHPEDRGYGGYPGRGGGYYMATPAVVGTTAATLAAVAVATAGGDAAAAATTVGAGAAPSPERFLMLNTKLNRGTK
ncbi:hypothetical protein MUK42_36430 [Musa troglodytarum]|uniref:Uncharacterized protein n=1 Tax=Musa troglodytarum TaxID=320322 RepID=A0A9E7JW34_9LILI|nr:hypothetical protein MUK42_36430 [Musa troglodytarum]